MDPSFIFFVLPLPLFSVTWRTLYSCGKQMRVTFAWRTWDGSSAVCLVVTLTPVSSVHSISVSEDKRRQVASLCPSGPSFVSISWSQSPPAPFLSTHSPLCVYRSLISSHFLLLLRFVNFSSSSPPFSLFLWSTFVIFCPSSQLSVAFLLLFDLLLLSDYVLWQNRERIYIESQL